MQPMIEEIYQTLTTMIGEKDGTPQSVWLRRYEPGKDSSENQFVTFLKPEATAVQAGVDVKGILQIVFDALSRWNVEVGAVRLLNARYLEYYQIMDQHYGVINNISRHGFDAISATAREVLQKDFGSDLASGAEVLGGHQFLERFPAFSPFALATIADNLGSKKLAGGTYCLRLKVEGQIFLILNAFHPFQLEHFTAQGKVIVILETRSKTSWAILRQQLVGATIPANAAEGSIRRTLLNRHEELHMPDVSPGNNGVHLSAGPLEGMVELQRFCSEPEKGSQLDLRETCFGRLLLSKGLPQNLLTELAKNPTLEIDGRSISAFDLTEEMDSDPAAEKLIALARSGTIHTA